MAIYCSSIKNFQSLVKDYVQIRLIMFVLLELVLLELVLLELILFVYIVMEPGPSSAKNLTKVGIHSSANVKLILYFVVDVFWLYNSYLQKFEVLALGWQRQHLPYIHVNQMLSETLFLISTHKWDNMLFVKWITSTVSLPQLEAFVR